MRILITLFLIIPLAHIKAQDTAVDERVIVEKLKKIKIGEQHSYSFSNSFGFFTCNIRKLDSNFYFRKFVNKKKFFMDYIVIDDDEEMKKVFSESAFSKKDSLVEYIILYKNGVRNGPSIGLNENGDANFVQNFKKGTINGMQTSFYNDGTLSSHGKKVEGALEEGLWSYFYENGRLKSQGEYIIIKKEKIRKGCLDRFSEFYCSHSSVQNGKWNYYDGQGSLVKTEIYDKGFIINTLNYEK